MTEVMPGHDICHLRPRAIHRARRPSLGGRSGSPRSVIELASRDPLRLKSTLRSGHRPRGSERAHPECAVPEARVPGWTEGGGLTRFCCRSPACLAPAVRIRLPVVLRLAAVFLRGGNGVRACRVLRAGRPGARRPVRPRFPDPNRRGGPLAQPRGDRASQALSRPRTGVLGPWPSRMSGDPAGGPLPRRIGPPKRMWVAFPLKRGDIGETALAPKLPGRAKARKYATYGP